MKIFFYTYEDEEDLKKEDASLCYGHMQFNDMVLFKTKKCMLLIAIVELFEKMVELEKKDGMVNWFVTDNGEKVILEKIKEKLTIKYFDTFDTYNFSAFKNCYLKKSKHLSDYLLLINPNIKEEAAFIDLNNLCLDNTDLTL